MVRQRKPEMPCTCKPPRLSQRAVCVYLGTPLTLCFGLLAYIPGMKQLTDGINKMDSTEPPHSQRDMGKSLRKLAPTLRKLAMTLTQKDLCRFPVGLMTTCWSQALTCLGSMDGKSPLKKALPVEPRCLKLCIASCHQHIQLTSPCVCSSRTSTQLAVLVLSLWAEWRLVSQSKYDGTFAPVNVTTEVESGEITRNLSQNFETH